MKKRLLGMVCLLLTAAGTLADSHWTVNPHAFQYDMTAYVTLAWVEQSDYEVAAFCGDECRGVGKLLTATDGTQVFQLRIRSNEASGETISFRAFNNETHKEMQSMQTITFESQTVLGSPSQPLKLNIGIVLKGDANGDGNVDTQDAIKAIQYYLGKNPTDFNFSAADVTGDGNVDTQDAIQIIKIYLNKQ